MKPYYEADGITIYHGEACAMLAQLPEASVDVLLTDPPYSSGGQFKGDRGGDPAQKYANRLDLGTFSGDNLRDAYDVAEAWGFTPSQVLTWCKAPHGLGPGGAFANTTEFCLFARRNCAHRQRMDSTWWEWPRAAHSVKPAAFFDMVEQVSPGPYVELFARQPRLGWDHWGHGYEMGGAA